MRLDKRTREKEGAKLTTDFWQPKTLQQHIEEQQVKPIRDITELVADFWPEDESADYLVTCIYEQRLEDRQRG